MTPAFDMDALRTLVAGADLGSFARAATRLGRSQSAISMQIKKLELQAGQKLFRKQGRVLERTEAGETLLAYARRILALNDEAAASVGAVAARATVRIGLPQDFANDILPAVIARFCKQWPHVHVEAQVGRNFAIADDIAEGRLDVALVFVPAEAKAKQRDTDVIARLPMRWIARKGYAAGGQPVPLVMFDHACLFRQAALDALEGQGVPWRLTLTTPSLPGVWAALRTGLGVSVRIAHDLPPGLCDVSGAFKQTRLPDVGVKLLATRDLSPAAAALRDILEDAARAALAPKRGGAARKRAA